MVAFLVRQVHRIHREVVVAFLVRQVHRNYRLVLVAVVRNFLEVARLALGRLVHRNCHQEEEAAARNFHPLEAVVEEAQSSLEEAGVAEEVRQRPDPVEEEVLLSCSFSQFIE